MEETREQLVGDNGVQPAHLDAVTLKIFLGTQRRGGWSMERWLRRVYEHAGDDDRLIWTADRPGEFVRRAESRLVSESSE